MTEPAGDSQQPRRDGRWTVVVVSAILLTGFLFAVYQLIGLRPIKVTSPSGNVIPSPVFRHRHYEAASFDFDEALQAEVAIEKIQIDREVSDLFDGSMKECWSERPWKFNEKYVVQPQPGCQICMRFEGLGLPPVVRIANGASFWNLSGSDRGVPRTLIVQKCDRSDGLELWFFAAGTSPLKKEPRLADAVLLRQRGVLHLKLKR
jgi:hypothetical protein